LHTPRCSATSATLSSRSRPPQRTRRSASVGATLARCRVFGAGVPPCPSTAAGAPPCAFVAAPDSGTKWVPKLFVKPVDNCESLDCGLMSVCNGSAGLVPFASPCDGPGPVSGTTDKKFEYLLILSHPSLFDFLATRSGRLRSRVGWPRAPRHSEDPFRSASPLPSTLTSATNPQLPSRSQPGLRRPVDTVCAGT
jgi:hypothetical protein